MMQHALEKIVVVPRNGYINRLQAWASAAILGADLDVPISVAWEPEPVAPVAADDLFDASLARFSFWTSSQLLALAGVPHQQLPRYLSVDPGKRLIVLAGHDRGEQAFMPDLQAALAHPCRPSALLIIAGGKFALPESADPVRQRRIFYSRLAWQSHLNERFDEARLDHPEYVGLHVRGTDRSREAPPHRDIRRGLERLASSAKTKSLFIAADTASSLEGWTGVARELGFIPWSQAHVDHDRSSVAGGVDAMLDWRLLGAAQAIVYAAASSFGEEAAVATGSTDSCIALAATPHRQQARAVRDLGRSALTYPRRHGWLGMSGR